jgi:murein DD-endopeptidase MepM/ murein hydrolase activator NlpD
VFVLSTPPQSVCRFPLDDVFVPSYVRRDVHDSHRRNRHLPSSESATPARAAETPPALSGRSLRMLRQVRTLRLIRRNVAIASSLFGLLLGAGYGIPTYAQPTEELSPPAAQTVTVSAQAAHAAASRDDYTVTVPPPLQWPVNPASRIADGFGARVAPCAGCSSYHEGVDFDAGYGTEVHAIAAGIVMETNNPNYSALGVHVTIQHLIGGQSITSVYGHMQHGSMKLKVGDIVTVGQVVGLVGNTGASTGAHLHFEVHVGSSAVNPLAWMHARLG